MAITKKQTVKSFKQYVSLYKNMSDMSDSRIEDEMWSLKFNWEEYLENGEKDGKFDTYDLFGGIGYSPYDDEQFCIDIAHMTERW